MNGDSKFEKVIQLILLIAIVETFSLICLKEGNINGKQKFILCGFLGYIVIVYILCKTLLVVQYFSNNIILKTHYFFIIVSLDIL